MNTYLLPSLKASQGSYAVNMESPLFLAKLKFQDSCSINNSDATACYHMGRLCLLLGEKEEALVYLKATLAQKPMLSPARLCLGLALGPGEGKYAKPLLWHGLTQYLTQVRADTHSVGMRRYYYHCHLIYLNVLSDPETPRDTGRPETHSTQGASLSSVLPLHKYPHCKQS